QLGAGVSEDAGVLRLGRVAGRRRGRSDEDDVRSLRAIPGRTQVCLVAEEADVEAALELARALGIQLLRRLDDGEYEPTVAALGRCEAGALRDRPRERRAAKRLRREIGLRLLTRFAIGAARLPE